MEIETKHLVNETFSSRRGIIESDKPLIHKKCKKIIQQKTRTILHEKEFDSEVNEYQMSINHHFSDERKENKHIVSHSDLVENEPDDFVVYRNGSNFHGTLSCEGMYPETYGSRRYVQLIDLDQNLSFGEFPLKRGQMFIHYDLEWSECEHDKCECESKQILVPIRCVYLDHHKHQLYGRTEYRVDYFPVQEWYKKEERYDDDSNKVYSPSNYITDSIKDLTKNYKIRHHSIIIQAGNFVKPFRFNQEKYEMTKDFFKFEGRVNFLQELDDYNGVTRKIYEQELLKEKKTEEKRAQQSNMENFF